VDKKYETRFHKTEKRQISNQRTPVCREGMNDDKQARINHLATDNFDVINQSLKASAYETELTALNQWSLTKFTTLEVVFEQRHKQVFIRECHGDMHLRNLAWINNNPVAFDCIEFSDELRWIDVMSEIAFLIMDLQDRQQAHLANRF